MLILGIDTGGTYTDGVIIERDSGTVLHTAKALTTPDDLAQGIADCMRALRFAQWDQIGMVGLSTTLATNAIVEGHGCRVGLVLLGGRPEGEIPAQASVQIDAHVNIRGGVTHPLHTQMIDSALQRLKGRCHAVAVSGYASVRNPEHELQVKERAVRLLGLPVVCGHEMTGALGYYERTVTTVLNARLLPLIRSLLDDVQKVMRELGVRAPLMVVRGDGSMMYADYAADRPVETVLSGPAASVTGARFLSGCENGVVVDIGGTTTDIAGLRHGECTVSEEGAVLSGWRTRVRALEIFTFGLGGDSEIHISDKGEIRIGPRRVVPLCRTAIVKGKAGLTPTDILHASGAYREWAAQKSIRRIHEVADCLSVTSEQMIEKLYCAVVGQIVKYCRLGAAALGGGGTAKLIGVGAPANSWLTAAAAQLKVPCIVPPHADVANAVGAAVGQVCETSQALVRCNRSADNFYVYLADRRLGAPDLKTAQAMARREVSIIARQKADRAGAVQTQVSCKEKLVESINRTFIEWRITAKATGYPESRAQEIQQEMCGSGTDKGKQNVS